MEAHLDGAAEWAERNAEVFQCGDWARVAALLHDLGKYNPRFQDYLLVQNGLKPSSAASGKVVHTTLGAQLALLRYGAELGTLLAYVVAGHHAGLPDYTDTSESGSDVRSSLKRRMQLPVDESIVTRIPRRYRQPDDLSRPAWLSAEGRGAVEAFRKAFFTRMLFSCLVDADWMDTEAFCDSERHAERLRHASGVGPDVLISRLQVYMDGFAAATGPVNERRREVLEACVRAATHRPGLFSLTVPTGGGKTLASLRFALEHAKAHEMRRVIYVIPFTSIIEQTANVFRKAVGANAVLEHHSNFDPGDRDEDSSRYKLLSENWDAPLVVTTGVQFYESLFACKTSRCRKLHNIAGSVIVLDEAQTLPAELLKPCMEVLRELVRAYGCTVVFCTATQPALTKAEYFPIGLAKGEAREIVPDPTSLYESMRRVSVEKPDGKLDEDALVERLLAEPKVLCVVNTRKHALRVYERMKERLDEEGGELASLFHLSALMCPAHRSEVLARIRMLAKPDCASPCRVVSTQLVEAGVDLDFPCVYRSMAGLDSIVQAAGRCNREGRLVDAQTGEPQKGRVYVFEPEEKGYQPFGSIKTAAQSAASALRRHKGDPLSLGCVQDFFQHYYQAFAGVKWDKPHVLAEDVLSVYSDGTLDAQFRVMDRRFRLIEDGSVAVLVPYGKKGEGGTALCAKIRDEAAALTLADFRMAQRYSVSVRERELNALMASGAVQVFREGRFPVLVNESAYDPCKGLDVAASGIWDAGELQR